jgi:very-short-patch-repair endonuclease
METWVRLIIVDAGLPEPVTDHDVFDDRGLFVGCVDLAYPLLRIAIEFEGDQHRTDPRQWQRDIEKHERLADLGWRVIRVSREHVFADPESIVRRVRGAIAARR